jgi:hypothetical protein
MTTQTFKAYANTETKRKSSVKSLIPETDDDKLQRTQIHQLHHQHATPVRNGMCTVIIFWRHMLPPSSG